VLLRQADCRPGQVSGFVRPRRAKRRRPPPCVPDARVIPLFPDERQSDRHVAPAHHRDLPAPDHSDPGDSELSRDNTNLTLLFGLFAEKLPVQVVEWIALHLRKDTQTMPASEALRR